uniref:MAT1 centre domain-containing protein n=1 Tax=Erythrolobus australicus TaxID=1077150 RepID=A0A7S1XHX9_9RHOD|mmetsp:Transcript_1836/g.4863  ORF Transcript_1836/g.4863 Transcript_1836/m.4863 type:complete len:107 (+) Transcript_1836:76-396(+)
MVEELVINLSEGINEEDTQNIIRKNRLENQDLIRINQAKKAEEDRMALERLVLGERKHRLRLEELRKQDLLADEERTLRVQPESRISNCSSHSACANCVCAPVYAF